MKDKLTLGGRVIKSGTASGLALVSAEPIGFLGGVDPDTGLVVEPGHPLEGQSVAGRVLVFPTGKGSTVGSYTLYRLSRSGLAPAAIVNAESEPIVAVGAIMAGLPMVDQVDITLIHTGDHVHLDGAHLTITPAPYSSISTPQPPTPDTRYPLPATRYPLPATDLVFLKLGGSVITDKTRPETPRPDVLARLAAEIAAARTARPGLRLVLGHGSGSFGHVAARRHGTRAGVHGAAGWLGFAEVAAVAARLNRIVTAALVDAGVPAFSVQPSASARCHAGELLSLDTSSIDTALAHGLVPLVYGDVAFDDVQGGTIISTEQIFAYLALRLRPSRLLLAGIVDGVYDADPLSHPDAAPIPHITPANWPAIRSGLGGSHATDVTGGMETKVESLIALVETIPGLSARILTAERPDALYTALVDPSAASGTLISAT